MPAKAGIHGNSLDSRLRGNDGEWVSGNAPYSIFLSSSALSALRAVASVTSRSSFVRPKRARFSSAVFALAARSRSLRKRLRLTISAMVCRLLMLDRMQLAVAIALQNENAQGTG